jgi:SRSO17 transposase
VLEPGPVPLAKLISVAVARWRIEEDHQQSKQVSGLDSGQVTSWTSWHRRTAISLLAYLFLAVAAAWQRARDEDAGLPGLIPVTIPRWVGDSLGQEPGELDRAGLTG